MLSAGGDRGSGGPANSERESLEARVRARLRGERAARLPVCPTGRRRCRRSDWKEHSSPRMEILRVSNFASICTVGVDALVLRLVRKSSQSRSIILH